MPIVRTSVIKSLPAPWWLGVLGYEFHQQAAEEVGGNLHGGAGEEGLGKGWELLGIRGGCGSGLGEEVLRDTDGAWQMAHNEG